MKRFKNTIFMLILLCNCFLTAQHLDIDYVPVKGRESSFRANLFSQGIVGVNTLKHFDSSVEILRLQYFSKKGNSLSFKLYGTRTFWVGNKVDALNTLSFLHNPVGGMFNANLMARFPIAFKERSSYRIAFQMGERFVNATPNSGERSPNFMDHYGGLGMIYQHLVYEDARNNESLYFYAFPSGIIHYSNKDKREVFFNNELQAAAYGYGLQLGIEWNKKLRFTIMAHQLLNAKTGSDLGRPAFRFATGYLF